MEIRAHLTDEELAQALTSPGKALLAHLDLCDDCRSEVERLRRVLERQSAESNPPQEFWQQQRMRIWQRIQAKESSPARAPHLAWAALAAMLALGGLWISDARTPEQTAPVTSHSQIDDDELMVAVERIGQTDMPEALEPASLLAREMSKGTKPRTQVQRTEGVHEN